MNKTVVLFTIVVVHLYIQHFSCIIKNYHQNMELTDILTNPGFDLITKSIVSYLDAKSAMQCRLLNQAWKQIIDQYWWYIQLQTFQKYSIPFLRRRRSLIDFVYGKSLWNTLCHDFNELHYNDHQANHEQVVQLVKLLCLYNLQI